MIEQNCKQLKIFIHGFYQSGGNLNTLLEKNTLPGSNFKIKIRQQWSWAE